MARRKRETEDASRSSRAASSWHARPVMAWTIRVVLFMVPLALSWLSVRYAVRAVPRPDTATRTIVWVVGAIALSTLVYYTGRRLLDRFSSLGMLYRLSLTFPEVAPSRMSTVMRAGRLDELQRRIGAQDETALDPRRKAERLVDLVTLVTRREVSNRGHAERVRAYAESIGEEIGLAYDEMQKLRWAALLHDVGMLEVPDRVVDQPGPLDDEGRRAVDHHPAAAIPYIEPFGNWLGEWALAVTEHHERWDGSGYPAGLSGTEISLAGRIVAVADAYDAMTSPRPYRKPISAADARQELVDGAGSQFDPDVVRAFLNVNIRRSRAGVGPLAAVIELPAQLGSLAPAASVTVGAVAAGTVAIAASVANGPPVVSSVTETPPAVERVIDETEPAPTTTASESTTTTVPTTIAPTTTSTTATTTTTTSVAPTTTATSVAPTTTSTTATTTTTSPPTTTTTTTVPGYPVVTTTTPTYPTTAP